MRLTVTTNVSTADSSSRAPGAADAATDTDLLVAWTREARMAFLNGKNQWPR
ncbi:MAG TPA: hypothetical protein VE665_07550 [Hyphomicrobiaceae bacterium]|jgi:hypothetical protein|nr:hypothetical protein [Hyphomicrobiaceae bacterium]